MKYLFFHTSKSPLFLLVLCGSMIVQYGCSKDKKLSKKLEDSEWNIDLYESYMYVSGVRDSAQDIVKTQAGFVKINKGGTGYMEVSNGIFIDSYRIEKWSIVKGNAVNKKDLSVNMDVLYLNNGTHANWAMDVLKNEESTQVWTRTAGLPGAELKNIYTLSLK